MNKICTSLEQSQTLIELGIDVNTADMYYPNRIGIDNYALSIEWKHGLPLLSQEIPAWSLNALLDIIPQEIFNEKYYLNITEGAFHKWIITYDYADDDNSSLYGVTGEGENLVDASIEIIKNLKKRNLL